MQYILQDLTLADNIIEIMFEFYLILEIDTFSLQLGLELLDLLVSRK